MTNKIIFFFIWNTKQSHKNAWLSIYNFSQILQRDLFACFDIILQIFIVNKMSEVERNTIRWHNTLSLCPKHWVISDVEFKYLLFEKFSHTDRAIYHIGLRLHEYIQLVTTAKSQHTRENRYLPFSKNGFNIYGYTTRRCVTRDDTQLVAGYTTNV